VRLGRTPLNSAISAQSINNLFFYKENMEKFFKKNITGIGKSFWE
jgi:hypothetical protein